MPKTFYPEDLKITHIKRCDDNIFRINFKVKEFYDSKNYKWIYSLFSVQESLGNSSVKTLSKFENNHWKTEVSVRDDKGLYISFNDKEQKSRIMKRVVSKAKRKDYDQKKKSYLKAIRSVPHSQLDMAEFSKLLNYFFSYESERNRYLTGVKKSLESNVKAITDICNGLTKDYKVTAAVEDLLTIAENLKKVIDDKSNWEVKDDANI